MAASRARWPVTASRTGRGGKAAPALLKWRTLATPGVSNLSDGTSSVMTASERRESRLAGPDRQVEHAEIVAAGDLAYFRSEERRVGKSVDLGGRRIIKKK